MPHVLENRTRHTRLMQQEIVRLDQEKTHQQKGQQKGQCSTGIWFLGQAVSFPQQRSLRTGLTKTASNDRMGLKDGLKPISAPLRCSAGEAQLLLAKKLHLSQMFCSQETWTHIQDSYCSYKICLRYHCSAMER